MASRHTYVAGSVLVALLGIGIVVYLMLRKPEVLDKSEHTYFFETSVPETAMQRLIRESDAAIAADDLQKI